MSHILVFGEKPAINWLIAPFISDKYPDNDIIYLNVIPYQNIKFNYPKGKKYSEYPVILDPECKVNSIQDFRPMRFVNNVMRVIEGLTEESLREIKRDWELIIYACDPDHSGAFAFFNAIKDWYGEDTLKDYRVHAIKLISLGDGEIKNSINNPKGFYDYYSKTLDYAKTKRFFDWNWNVNSFAIMSLALKMAGVSCQNPAISKYELQSFYFIKNNPELTEGEIYHEFWEWKGTGKYPRSILGSAASQSAQISHLIDLGLMNSAKKEGRGNANFFSITPIGERFFELLHKDTFDPDLPARIKEWGEAGFEQSRAGIERYIKTFFGKQKVKLGKMK